MLRFIFILLTLTFQLTAMAREHQKINSLGVSKKGQFVALEEYGYTPHKNSFYVHIKIMNVWKKEYVGTTFSIEVPAIGSNLKDAREKAKNMAKSELERFNIST